MKIIDPHLRFQCTCTISPYICTGRCDFSHCITIWALVNVALHNRGAVDSVEPGKIKLCPGRGLCLPAAPCKEHEGMWRDAGILLPGLLRRVNLGLYRVLCGFCLAASPPPLHMLLTDTAAVQSHREGQSQSLLGLRQRSCTKHSALLLAVGI